VAISPFIGCSFLIEIAFLGDVDPTRTVSTVSLGSSRQYSGRNRRFLMEGLELRFGVEGGRIDLALNREMLII
jgi:hypothetical protein